MSAKPIPTDTIIAYNTVKADKAAERQREDVYPFDGPVIIDADRKEENS